jgi:putative Mn2+ efflux pump MntP
MPHWLGSLILIILGLIGVYEGITNPCVTLRGMKRPLNKWQGRLWYAFFAAFCIGGGVAILLS